MFAITSIHNLFHAIRHTVELAMRYTLFAQKLALLLSPLNEMWKTPDNRDITRTAAMTDMLGVRFSTVASWSHRPTLEVSDVSDRAIDHLIAALHRIKTEHKSKISESMDEISREDLVGFLRASDFAAKLCIDRSTCNQILDEYIYDDTPLLPAFYFSTYDSAKTQYDKVKGLYNVYRYGTSSFNKDHVIVIKLHVRRLLAIGRQRRRKAAKRAKYAIRCKMQIPSGAIAGTNTPAWLEYDGFVAHKEKFLYWVFESRAQPVEDLIFMITPEKQKAEWEPTGEILSGTYVSINQEELPQVVNRNIALQQVKGDVDTFFGAPPKLLVEKECGQLHPKIRDIIAFG
jgi:hypothetical protein